MAPSSTTTVPAGLRPRAIQSFRAPSVSPAGEIAVIDFSKQGFVRFDATGAPLHIVHLGSSGLGQGPKLARMIDAGEDPTEDDPRTGDGPPGSPK